MNKRYEIHRNEEGSAIIIALVVMVMLTIIGFSALNDSTVEMEIAGNEKIYKRDFYNAENGLNRAVADFQNRYDSNFDNIRTADPKTANCTFNFNDDDGNAIVRIEAKAITIGEDDGSGVMTPYDTDALTPEAENVPLQSHVGPAPDGFGSDFMSRRFAVTATAIDPLTGNDTNVTVQAGVTVAVDADNVVPFVGIY